MHESTASLPEGIITGGSTAYQSYGLFDECIDTRGPNTTGDGSSTLFDGKYCSVFFYFVEVQPDELVNSSTIIQERGNFVS